MPFIRCAQFFLLLLVIPSVSYAADNAASRALHQLFDQDWEYQMAHDPVAASELGDRRWNDQWENLSLDSLHEQFQHAREMLTRLHAIDRAQLSPEDQISYDVFEYNSNDYLEGEQYKWYLVRTDTFDGIQTVENVVDSLRFETVKDYDDWLGRMHNFPAYMDQNIGLMREGIKEHILLRQSDWRESPHPTQRYGLEGPGQARLLQAVSENAAGVLRSGQAAPDRRWAANHQDRCSACLSALPRVHAEGIRSGIV